MLHVDGLPEELRFELQHLQVLLDLLDVKEGVIREVELLLGVEGKGYCVGVVEHVRIESPCAASRMILKLMSK